MQGLISFFGNMRPSASVCTPVGVGGGELDMDIMVSGSVSIGLCAVLCSVSVIEIKVLSINIVVELSSLLEEFNWHLAFVSYKSNNAATTMQHKNKQKQQPEGGGEQNQQTSRK